MRPPALGLWLLACCLTEQALGKPKKAAETKVNMPHHSYMPPLDYASLLDDWLVSGSALFLRERLLLHPNVLERTGFVWSKWPLLTNSFEVVIHFRVAGGAISQTVPLDQTVAVWYIQESVAASYNESKIIQAPSWLEGLTAEGYTFGGSRSKFDGFGAVLLLKDEARGSQPSVSLVMNDGSRESSVKADVPSTNAHKVEARNTQNAVQLKIRVGPSSIEGHILLAPGAEWTECFKAATPVKPNGFLGFTAWSGTSAGNPGVMADSVSIEKVEVWNMDETTLGEEVVTDLQTGAQVQENYRDMLLDEHKHFADQKEQAEHIARLTAMVNDFVTESMPAEQRILDEVGQIEVRMGNMATDCATVVKETHILMNSERKLAKPGATVEGIFKEIVDSTKNEIIGLRRLLVRDNAVHKEKLEAVQKNINEVKQKQGQSSNSHEVLGVIDKQTESLEKTVSTRGIQMSWMLIVLMVVIIAFGALMWNRMQYYEKKHFRN